MKIETKYNIGDEVWINILGCNEKAKVVTIVCYVCIDGSVLINYQLTAHGVSRFRNESAIFNTKDEIIKEQL